MKTEAVMGRADVLFYFLQLIEKDKPEDIDKFLENVNIESDGRPIADQLVDLIIAGDKSLYDSYAAARKMAGPVSPYSTKSKKGSDGEYKEALGYFMSQWIAFEQKTREFASNNIKPSNHVMSYSAIFEYIPESINIDIKYIRKLRNEVVHGIVKSTSDQLNEAGQMLENVNKEIG